MERERFNQPVSEFQPNRLIANALIKELAGRGLSISIAEDRCTGGGLLDALTIPGATKVFHVGGIFPTPESKISPGVPQKTIIESGENSLATALAMARAIQKIRNDSLAIATVGGLSHPDKSNPCPVFLGFSAIGKKPWGKAVRLQPASRRIMKEQIVKASLSSALFYLLGQKDRDIKDHLPFFHLEKPPTPLLLEMTKKAQSFVSALKTLDLSLVLMESCTGGALAHAITDVLGSSEVLRLGLVAYDEKEKERQGVDPKVMKYGAYTEKVALVMAEAVYNKTGADMAIATTGTMDTIDTRPYHNDNPPGTIYVAIILRGRKPLVCQLSIKPRLREKMKIETVSVVFDLALEVLTRPEEKLSRLYMADNELRFLNKSFI